MKAMRCPECKATRLPNEVHETMAGAIGRVAWYCPICGELIGNRAEYGREYERPLATAGAHEREERSYHG